MTYVRILVSLSTTYHCPLYQLDIKNVFNGILDEKVYMEQPPGFATQGEHTKKVCKLNKLLYDLKQSQRAWSGHFALEIQKFGLCRAKKNHSVFWWIQHETRILLVVYVNDIVITGADTKEIDSLKKYLQKHFQTKDLGSLKYLGIEVARSKKGILLPQKNYVLDLLSKLGC